MESQKNSTEDLMNATVKLDFDSNNFDDFGDFNAFAPSPVLKPKENSVDPSSSVPPLPLTENTSYTSSSYINTNAH